MSSVLEITQLGMINDMERLNAISNNLANVNTAGFKREIPVTRAFENMLLQQVDESGFTIDDRNTDTRPVVKSYLDHSPGMFKFTGNNFDVAIEGEGFLEVTKAGGVFYTRQGTLTLDAGGRLVTSGGYVVNGISGEVRMTTSEPRIDEQGRIWEKDNQIGQLKLVNFKDPRQLEKVGGGLYESPQANTVELDHDQIRIRQGYLESSNVVMMNEMVQMMELMRHFESSQRVMKGYDELLDSAIRTLGDF